MIAYLQSYLEWAIRETDLASIRNDAGYEEYCLDREMDARLALMLAREGLL